MRIHEPTTALTDFMIFLLGIYLARSIYVEYLSGQMNVHFYFSLGVGLMGVAALFGALTHGIGPNFSPDVHQILWKITLVTIGFTTITLLFGGIAHVVPWEKALWFRWALIIVLVLYLIASTKTNSFKIVILFYVPAMLVLMILMVYSYMKFHSVGTLQIIMSVLIAFAGAAVQQSGFSIHKHFNHNDLYHIIQMVSMFVMYKGVILLKDFSQ